VKNINDICLIVQARLGSQRCPNKMIRPFANSTLTDIAIDKVLGSKVLPKENFYLAVHEPELISIGKNRGVNVFERSEKSANSEGTPMTEIFEWWDKLPYKYVLMLNACCSLLTTETVDSFIKHYLQTDSDGLFGVIEKKNYFWNTNGELITPWPDGEAILNTKMVGTTLEAAHCLYAGSMPALGENIWMGDYTLNNPELFVVPEEETFDVDYEWQFGIAETLYKAKQSKQ
jgi:CMP-N-acetylneuraminic acid synthetase